MDEIPHVGADAPPDDVEVCLRRAGAVVVDDLLDAETLDRLEAELRPHLDRTEAGTDDFTGLATRRTGSLIARSPTFHRLAAHPVVLGALDRVLGDHATSYQLHLTQVIDIGPGEAAQMIHRDQWAFDFFPFPKGYEVECHTMWALTEFTEENGATRVIPGSHEWDDGLQPDPDLTVPAAMSRGSVMLYLGSLYHGGGANHTDRSRLGVNVGYTLSWLRQEENQYLACPPEIARDLPTDLARLVGYARGAYALGYWGDLQDPLEFLHGPSGEGPGFAP